MLTADPNLLPPALESTLRAVPLNSPLPTFPYTVSLIKYGWRVIRLTGSKDGKEKEEKGFHDNATMIFVYFPEPWPRGDLEGFLVPPSQGLLLPAVRPVPQRRLQRPTAPLGPLLRHTGSLPWDTDGAGRAPQAAVGWDAFTVLTILFFGLLVSGF